MNAGMQQVRSDLKRSRRSEESDSSGFHPTVLFYIHLGQACSKDAPWGLVTRTLLRSKIAELLPAGQSQRVIKEPLCLLYAAGKLGFCACVVKVGVKTNPAVSEYCTLYKKGERSAIVWLWNGLLLSICHADVLLAAVTTVKLFLEGNFDHRGLIFSLKERKGRYFAKGASFFLDSIMPKLHIL